MASYDTLKNGRVRVFVCVNGIRDSATLANKQKAKSWAREREYELAQQNPDKIKEEITLGELFEKYACEISPTKKGGRSEIVRLNSFQKHDTLYGIKLIDLTREDLEEWIDLRLTQVKSSSVNRELNLISHCLTQARRWRLMCHNPFKDLKRPTNPPPRFRRIQEHEITQLRLVLGYREDIILTRKHQFVAVAFLFAIETAMRAGEICILCQALINFETNVAHLPDTKNGDSRDVPLSPRAIELLRKLPEQEYSYTPMFQLKAASLDTLFRKYRERTTIEDLHFHDTRHEAITRLAKIFDVLPLARIVGHRDIKQLMIYYNESAEELAQRFMDKKEKYSGISSTT